MREWWRLSHGSVRRGTVDGGSSQSAAVEAGLKQGFAGWSGHGCGRTGTQGTAGRGRM